MAKKRDLRITQEMAEDMAQFYLNTFFAKIPAIPVHIENIPDGSLGVFYLEEGEDYDPYNDELMNAYEYRSRYKPLWGGLGGIDLNRDQSYQDPLNHPKVSIRISKSICICVREFVGTLMHELLHYYLWYIGWDFHDEDIVFYRECRKMGLPTNYAGKSKDDTDYKKIDQYIRMYIEYTSDRKLAKAKAA